MAEQYVVDVEFVRELIDTLNETKALLDSNNVKIREIANTIQSRRLSLLNKAFNVYNNADNPEYARGLLEAYLIVTGEKRG